MHLTIKSFSQDLIELKFNKALAKARELYNYISDLFNRGILVPEIRDAFEVVVRLLNPIMPHTTEEIWYKLGNTCILSKTQWPSYDEDYIFQENIMLSIQINGKFKNTLQVLAETPETEIKDLALKAMQKDLQNKIIKKIFIIQNRTINLVVV